MRKHGVAAAPGDTAPKRKFFPEQVFKDTVGVAIAFIILFLMAMFAKVPLERLADPTDTAYIPRPEWYFLFLFQTLKFFKGPLETVGSVVLPGVAVLTLFLIPFIDRGPMIRLGQTNICHHFCHSRSHRLDRPDHCRGCDHAQESGIGGRHRNAGHRNSGTLTAHHASPDPAPAPAAAAWQQLDSAKNWPASGLFKKQGCTRLSMPVRAKKASVPI